MSLVVYKIQLSPGVFAAKGPADPIEVFKFPEEVMEAAEASGMALPFAVVGSRENDVLDGEEEPLRHYSWGTCLPLRKEHSDAVFFRYGGTLLVAILLCLFAHVQAAWPIAFLPREAASFPVIG